MSIKEKIIEKVAGKQMSDQVDKLTKHLENIDNHLESATFKLNELVNAYNGMEDRLEAIEKEVLKK